MTAESMKSIQQLKELTKDGKVTNKRFIRTKEGVELYQMGKTKFFRWQEIQVHFIKLMVFV